MRYRILLLPLIVGFAVLTSHARAPIFKEYLGDRFASSSLYPAEINRDNIPSGALVENDLFEFYRIDVDNLTPLKKKKLMESDEYKEKKDRMDRIRASFKNALGHVYLDLPERPTYDLDREGFLFKISPEKYWQHGKYEEPMAFQVPKSLAGKIRLRDDDFRFFVPLANQDVALEIEEEWGYNIIFLFDYFPKRPEPSQGNRDYNNASEATYIFKLYDVILHKQSTDEIVWSALLGDRSEEMKSNVPDDGLEDVFYDGKGQAKMDIVPVRPEDKYSAVKQQVIVNPEHIEEKPRPDQIYSSVEQPAEFPGGQSALMIWLSSNIRYPEMAMQNGVQGRVIVKFVVEKDGSFSSIEVVKGVDEDLDKEALRVVRKMPKWQPAMSAGVPVRSYFVLPITFKLQSQ